MDFIMEKLSNTSIKDVPFDPFCMNDVLDILKDCIKPRKELKVHNFKSFTKRHGVHWKITYYDNGDVECNCPSFKYYEGRCKHLKHFNKKQVKKTKSKTKRGGSKSKKN